MAGHAGTFNRDVLHLKPHIGCLRRVSVCSSFVYQRAPWALEAGDCTKQILENLEEINLSNPVMILFEFLWQWATLQHCKAVPTKASCQDLVTPGYSRDPWAKLSGGSSDENVSSPVKIGQLQMFIRCIIDVHKIHKIRQFHMYHLHKIS